MTSILTEKSPDNKVLLNQHETLFHRHPGNPILTGKDWPYSMNSVFNAGATLLPDGTTLLLCRVEAVRPDGYEVTFYFATLNCRQPSQRFEPG